MIIERPITIQDISDDLMILGVQKGMTLLVHSSLKSIGGWVVGGPEAVILALEEVLGEEGTLVMPTQSANLTNPEMWGNPPADPKWWELIREGMPPYHPDMTVTTGMGIIPEVFRKQEGVIRSAHPHVSFAARGRNAESLMHPHALDYSLGETSPLARLYETGAYVLMLGSGYGNNTSFHLSEYRADWEGKRIVTAHAPVRRVQGRTEWEAFQDITYHSDDFEALGTAFEVECREAYKHGRVGKAKCILAEQRAMVDYAVRWMEENR
ncbi:Aminoglycoside N(3')-acetyltransferase [Paenibacillus vortex V453]|uniref:Aminoglycoside N(3)-acetyltransferase n=1 Tax=Paenibacillus vortex V453 TaxID=715225 RepID=A0A2R9SMZ3_9BACL|nr:AAC(3) family N-acetyltransferase [Paenibacillus vortex]EFU38718.1 Aminoglycoside N(3')-acetyltransferase [Paenibacillus vortex V453]